MVYVAKPIPDSLVNLFQTTVLIKQTKKISQDSHKKEFHWDSILSSPGGYLTGELIPVSPSFFFWPHPWQAEIPGPGIKPVPQQWRCWILSHWATRKLPKLSHFNSHCKSSRPTLSHLSWPCSHSFPDVDVTWLFTSREGQVPVTFHLLAELSKDRGQQTQDALPNRWRLYIRSSTPTTV